MIQPDGLLEHAQSLAGIRTSGDAKHLNGFRGRKLGRVQAGGASTGSRVETTVSSSPTVRTVPGAPMLHAKPNQPLPSTMGRMASRTVGADVHHRYRRRTFAGSENLAPVSWSIWGMAQRGHGRP